MTRYAQSLAALLMLGFGSMACEQAATQAPEGPPIGMQRLELADPARLSWDGAASRPLATTVWYPAAEGAGMTEVLIPSDKPAFTGGFAARGAEARQGARLPLVLVSHGTGGSGLQMMWLARRLAAEGYIVAAVDHHGNTAAEAKPDPRGFRLPWERARDLSAVLDQLLEHPEFGPMIDPARIGAAGFSLGGYTVIALAGGRTSLEQFSGFCASAVREATCDPQTEYPEAEADFNRMLAADPALQAAVQQDGADYGDPRISSFAALAPALGQAFTRESLSGLNAPVLIIGGDSDNVAPWANNAGALAGLIPGAAEAQLPGATHYVFLNECTSRGRRFVPVCKDPESLDRSALHDDAARKIIDHFNTTLPPV